VLGRLVVAGDEHVELLPVDPSVDERAREGRVERLHDRRSFRDEPGDLLRRGAPPCRHQSVPRGRVERVRNVDDDPTGNAVGVLLDGRFDGRVVDGQDHDLATERRIRLERDRRSSELLCQLPRVLGVVVDDLDLMSPGNGAGRDPAAHVPRTDDRELHPATS
jgi:hypothetical protein